MASNGYQMWLTHNGGKQKLRFPVHPESYTVTNSSKNTSVDIIGLGEIIIKQDRPALTIEFESFFPAKHFPGVQVDKLLLPRNYREKIDKYKDSGKPVQFMITGTTISMYCKIENVTWREEGGDVGTIHYSIMLKEDRSVSVRQIHIEDGKASVPAKTPARPDNTENERTYTVKKGDCLWNISKRFLGKGNRYMEIYELNRDRIKNPRLIRAGWVLRIPSK